MRRVVLGGMFAIATAAGVLAQTTGRSDSLTGEIRTPGSTELVLAADATGDLPGYFTLSIRYENRRVEGGSWVLVHRQTNADGSEEDIGMIEGVLASSSAVFGDDGSLASMTSIQLKIESGSGTYEKLTSGTGSVEGTVTGRNGVAFTGTLKLALP